MIENEFVYKFHVFVELDSDGNGFCKVFDTIEEASLEISKNISKAYRIFYEKRLHDLYTKEQLLEMKIQKARRNSN